MENPNLKWMMTGGTPIYGKPHLNGETYSLNHAILKAPWVNMTFQKNMWFWGQPRAHRKISRYVILHLINTSNMTRQRRPMTQHISHEFWRDESMNIRWDTHQLVWCKSRRTFGPFFDVLIGSKQLMSRWEMPFLKCATTQNLACSWPKLALAGSSKMNREWLVTGDITCYTGWWLGHPSEKYESLLGWLFPIYGKIKNVPNHQPV